MVARGSSGSAATGVAAGRGRPRSATGSTELVAVPPLRNKTATKTAKGPNKPPVRTSRLRHVGRSICTQSRHFALPLLERELRHQRGGELESEPAQPCSAPLERLGACLAGTVDDRDPVALNVVRSLLGQAQARAYEDLDSRCGLRDRLDEGISEGSQHVADGDAVGTAGSPLGIGSARERE